MISKSKWKRRPIDFECTVLINVTRLPSNDFFADILNHLKFYTESICIHFYFKKKTQTPNLIQWLTRRFFEFHQVHRLSEWSVLVAPALCGTTTTGSLTIPWEAAKFALTVTLSIACPVFESITSGLWKLLFIIFMCCCCGFQCMVCVLCIFTCIDLFGEPCHVKTPHSFTYSPTKKPILGSKHSTTSSTSKTARWKARLRGNLKIYSRNDIL